MLSFLISCLFQKHREKQDDISECFWQSMVVLAVQRVVPQLSSPPAWSPQCRQNLAGLPMTGGMRLCCSAHRGVSGHVGHVLNSSSLVTKQEIKSGFELNILEFPESIIFTIAKVFFVGLWKQKIPLAWKPVARLAELAKLQSTEKGGWVGIFWVYEYASFSCTKICSSSIYRKGMG